MSGVDSAKVGVSGREKERNGGDMSGQLCVKSVHGDMVRCKKIDAAHIKMRIYSNTR